MIVYVQPIRTRRGWNPTVSVETPTEYRIEPASRDGKLFALVRRWYTDRVTSVPATAHPRYANGADGQPRLIGFDELMCQHRGDFADCIATAELTRLGIGD